MIAANGIPVSSEFSPRVKQLFNDLSGVRGLSITVRDKDGKFTAVTDQQGGTVMPCPAESCETVLFPVQEGAEDGAAVQFTFHDVPREIQNLVTSLAHRVIEADDAFRREEALLDELGTNWENLENLYELTVEIQGSHNTGEMLGRLLARLGPSESELRAGLFVEEDGQLIPVAVRNACLQSLTWDRIPVLARMVQARHVTLVDPELSFDGNELSWSKARTVAVAPLATRSSVFGFVVIWHDADVPAFDSSQLRLLEAIAHQAAVTIERDRLMRAVRESERVQRELEIAGSIHQLLLVSKPPEASSQIEVAGFNLPSQKVDGDFHDYLTFPDQTLDVLVGDVMGKGISAALVGAATKNNFLKAVAHLSLQATGGKPEVSRIVSIAASSLYDSLVTLERFVTVCYARFDLQKKALQFVDCGHTGIIRNRKQTGEMCILRGGSLPIGIDKNERYEQFSHDLLPGDNFLFYSDGVTEARNSNGEFFGDETLSDCFRSWSSLPACEVIQRIRCEVMAFIGSAPLTDDFTCVVVKIKAAEAPCAGTVTAEFPAALASLQDARGWFQTEAMSFAPATLDPDSLAEMELSLSEIFTNSVIHGDAKLPIRLTIDCFADQLRVTVSYLGRGFDISKVSLPSFDGTREGGFGIYIVSRCADEFIHNQREDGTCAISFSKYFQGKV